MLLSSQSTVPQDDDMARIVRFSQIGSAEVLQIAEIPEPEPGPGELLIEVKAIGINPIEWKLRSGVRPLPPSEEPYRLGSDAAGTVLSAGANTVGFSKGQRVAVSQASGAYTTHLVAPVSKVANLPDSLTFEQGAALGIPAATAYQSLISLGVTEVSSLLVHGGSGGVGQAAIQIARAWGVDVVATASPANHDRLRELGATPVAHGTGLLGRLHEIAPDGFDRILDAVGTDEALEASFELVSQPSHIATIVQGAKAAALGIQAYSGGSPQPLTDEQQKLRTDALPYVLDLAVQGKFDIEISDRFGLDQVADAHRKSEAGHVRGKIVLLP